MLTRLLLLAGLFLGLITPPTPAAMEAHCQDHATAIAGADHHGGAPRHHSPMRDAGHHCPPVACAVAVHCSSVGGALLASAPELPAQFSTSLLGSQVARRVDGPTLQPPTPPPDRQT